MTKRTYYSALAAMLAALFIMACNQSNGLMGPTGVSGGTTFAIADKPPSNPNVGLSCPSDAPTELTVVVDDYVPGRGWKVTIDLRRTGANIPKYLVWYQRVGDPAIRSLSLSGARPITTEYFPVAGVYGFRAQSSCFDGYGNLGPVVVKNVGAGSFGPDVPPPPVEPPTEPPSPPVVPVCVETSC